MLYEDAYTLGNLLFDDTSVIAKRYASISGIAKNREEATEDCAKCLARTICQRGCMALAVMKTGDPLTDDGECTFRKLQILGYEMMKQGGELNDK